jgi:hypothetical protein
MFLFGKLRPLYFFTAFAVGLLFVYMVTPPPQVVVKFPSPYNASQIVYKDSNEQCYRYKAEKSECPVDKSKIKPQPHLDIF